MEFMRLLAESSESSILASEALLVAGVALFAWSTWGFIDRHYPNGLAGLMRK